MTTTTNPYAATFDDYWKAGWRGILPLPHGKKKFPPEGYTGHQGAYPSYPDCYAWSENGPQNIALRMPENVIGIDVDAYGDKKGAETLANLVEKYGPLPATYLSTSRDDGISGIRFYRVPEGTVLPSKLPGIEFIQKHHRYAVVEPSEHPETNRVYRWINESDLSSSIPNVYELPYLPQAWIDGLQTESKQADKATVNADEQRAILAQLPLGEPCHHIKAAAGNAFEGGDRHDSYNEAVLAVLSAGRSGCPGALNTIVRLRSAFISEVTQPGTTSRRSLPEAEAEWQRGMDGAIAIVANDTQGHACPDDAITWLEDIGVLHKPQESQSVNDEPSPEEQAYQATVRRKVADLKILDDAREQFAAIKAGEAEPLEPINLADFLDQDDEDVKWRVQDLWPQEGRVLLVAAAKSGKTTMVARNLLPDLVDGGVFLDRFLVEPIDGQLVYLNMEVGPATLRGWMRHANIQNKHKITVVNLRGKASSLQLSSEAGRKRFADFLVSVNASMVFADPLAPILAAHGLEEDSNSDVAKFFAWWSEALTMAGVSDDLICHHAGHAGQRSRGASRLLDEPDAIWTITREMGKPDDDEMMEADDRRFLTCYGRDVDLKESGLDFDPATGRLSLIDGSPAVLRQQARDAKFESVILERMRISPGVQMPTREIIKSGGNERKLRDALDRLVAKNVIHKQDLGKGRATLFTYIPPNNGELSPLSPTVAKGVATTGVAAFYEGDTHPSGSDGVEKNKTGDSRLLICFTHKQSLDADGNCPICLKAEQS